MTSSGNPISKQDRQFDVATSYSRITLTASRENMRHFGQPGFCDQKQCTKDSVEMIKLDKLLADLKVQRLINLLGQYGLRADDCARLLRRLAEWYQPSDQSVCKKCDELFKSERRSAQYCSHACKQSAHRKRKRNVA